MPNLVLIYVLILSQDGLVFLNTPKNYNILKKPIFFFVAKTSKGQNIYLSEENGLTQAPLSEDIRDFKESFQNGIKSNLF